MIERPAQLRHGAGPSLDVLREQRRERAGRERNAIAVDLAPGPEVKDRQAACALRNLGGGSPGARSRPGRGLPGANNPKTTITPPVTTVRAEDLRRSPATRADSDPRS